MGLERRSLWKKSLYEDSFFLQCWQLLYLWQLRKFQLKLFMENVVDMNIFLKTYDLMKSGFGANPVFSLKKSHN